ncbi:hypothetical protein [Marinobacter zhanjiangensis]|uniref:Signal recognition particle subunit FFH/SRP54 (Srp54) n=1 Tax=Marinobacter zhanjiangensis TaxID=578215 RepID=A0ABQ3AKW0_9GAMM|nr:hypothetical protein [Marinobacter zhanjiangensis]GGY60411.1 hypothetical protein GCM10007071_03810 [Marinobacter zhanjiangensis]
MNKFTRLMACSLLVSAPVLGFAQGNSGQMPQGGMMNQEQMQQMHDNMSRMQGMMQQMHDANPGAERERLRDQHMESMQEHMEMMRGGMMGRGQGMMGDGQGMMGNGQGMMNNQGQKQSGNSRGNRAGGADMDYGQRMQMMENRMNQMQLMMEQMLEHMDRNQRGSR